MENEDFEGVSPPEQTKRACLIASIPVNIRGNAFDVEPAGNHAVVASNAIYVLSLGDLSKVPEADKVAGSNARPDLGAVAWNPHSQTIATANKTVSVWKYSEAGQTYSLHCSMDAHKRAVTDLAWSPFRQHILATRSADCCVIWDVRQKSHAQRKHTIPEPVSATGVIKWNRHNADLLATTREGIVQLWDLRNASTPIDQITAHTQAIADLDWDYNNEKGFLTGAADKTVKFWDTTNTTSPKNTLSVSVPVVRSRYTPFGEGVVTLGRGQTVLTLWSLFDLSKPVHVYKSQSRGDTTSSMGDIQSFCWRIIKHGQPRAAQFQKVTQQYQLVSWGKDWCMNIWEIHKKHQEACFFTKTLFRGRTSSQEEVKRVRERSMSESEPLSSHTRRRDTPSSPELAETARAIPQEELDAPNEVTEPDPSPVDMSSLRIDSSPSPPAILGSPHTNTLLDLRQEFAFAKTHPIPKVEVEMDAIDKSCVVSYIYGEIAAKTCIFLKVSFPSFYPHARPSFHFLEGTNISHQRKLMLLRGLNKIAQFNMQHSRPCLRQSLLQLVKMQDYLDEEERQEREAKLRAEAEKLAAEQAAKEAAEKAIRDAAEKEMKEAAAKEAAEREAAEKANREAEKANKEAEENNKTETTTPVEGQPNETTPIEDSGNDPAATKTSPVLPKPEQPRSLFDRFKTRVRNLTGGDTPTQDRISDIEDEDKALSDGELETEATEKEEGYCEDEEEIHTEHFVHPLHPFVYHRSESVPIGRTHRAKDVRPKNPILAVKKELDEEAAHKAHQHQVEAAPFVGSPSLSNSYLSSSPLSRLVQTSELLSMKDFQKLTKFIPARFSMSDWKLVYSTMQHGISLHNFYRHAQRFSPTLIVVEDSNKYVFGGFMTGTWECALNKQSKFTGTGESFLFTTSPKFAVYKWSGGNEQFMMCEPDFIALGGGHNVGLYLDEEFENGCSKRSDTYLNNPLASSEDFSVVVVELWGLA